MEELWTPTSVVLVLTTIGVIIDKTITSFYNGRKLAMIEAHVNSQKTADATKIQALENESRMLREQAADNTRIAAVLAQAQTQYNRTSTVQETVRERQPKVLTDIRKNTEATVEAVKDLKENTDDSK